MHAVDPCLHHHDCYPVMFIVCPDYISYIDSYPVLHLELDDNSDPTLDVTETTSAPCIALVCKLLHASRTS